MAFVIALGDLTLEHLPLAGAKAVNLGRMMRAGLPVPAGFCLTVAASGAPDLRAALGDAWRRLGGGPVAVRSSALAEDLAGRSYAGQYHTSLDVRDLNGIEAAVRTCWASLEGRARAYDPSNAQGMAVIVQRMVFGTASGVAFGADPVYGGRGAVIIEACEGLGEKLVSGQASPERWVVLKADQRVVMQGSCLSPREAVALTRYVNRIESLFDTPQDVEWTSKDGHIHVLQSRPITTLRSPCQVWTNANAGEVVPDVVTPVTWSLVDGFVRHIFEVGVGVSLGAAVLADRVAGRCYFNLNTLLAILCKLPSWARLDLTDLLGGTQGTDALRAAYTHMPTLRLHPARPLRLLMGLVRGQRWEQVARRLQPVPLGDMTREELADRLLELRRFILNGDDLLAAAATGMLPYCLLFWLCGRWFGDQSVAHRLMTGLSGMASAEAGLALWRLATGGDGDFDTFMADHGHHAAGEIELFNARWGERPDYVRSMIRFYIEQRDRMNPDEKHRQQSAIRQAHQAALEARVGGWRRVFLRQVVAAAQRGVLARENIKSLGVRVTWYLRLAVLEMGRRLAADGRLSNSDDLFFLSFDELDTVWQGGPLPDVMGRRRQYELDCTLNPPAVVIGDYRPDATPPPVTGCQVWRGLGVSPGVAVGRARVLLRPDRGETVEPGEVLVAPFTDPGWTPCFLPAAAIVMDQGGLLSHGAIVAREYGIPAVVNVGPATRHIVTGQTVRVDGDRGEVTVD